MRRIFLGLLIAVVASGCDSSTSPEDEFAQCVDRARDILPTEVTLAFNRDVPGYHDNGMVGVHLKNGWELISATTVWWLEGEASKGENTDWFYQKMLFGNDNWLSYSNGGSVEDKDLIMFVVQLVLDPVDGSVAPDDGVAVDFRVVESVFKDQQCLWQD